MPSRKQLKQLQFALINAFPSKSLLERLLYFELEKNLNEITRDSNLQDIVFNLIQTAEAQGWLEDLVCAAYNENSGNPLLQAIAQELGIAQDDLSSDRNVDYTQLRNLLAEGNWKEADYETYLVMLKVVSRKDGDWIRDEELLNFPCTDLRTIDCLWAKYSNGRFGFSVQKKIYREVGGIPDGKFHQEAWDKFGDAVGWRVKGNWILYDEASFDTIAPCGHFPVPHGSGLVGLRSLLSHRDL